MLRKDQILVSFLTHELLVSKYALTRETLPTTVADALHSEIAIVKAIALIVDGLERSDRLTRVQLRTQILQFLNTVAI